MKIFALIDEIENSGYHKIDIMDEETIVFASVIKEEKPAYFNDKVIRFSTICAAGGYRVSFINLNNLIYTDV
jgi:hypothetical protein